MSRVEKTAAHAANMAAGPKSIEEIRFSFDLIRGEQSSRFLSRFETAGIISAQDLERRNYGMQEKTIGKLYIEAVGLSQANSKAKSVLQYRDPNRQRGTTAAAPAGDFATVLEREILQGYCPSKFSEWTIKDVNDWLDKLSSAADNADKKKELIKQVIFNLSARENKWLVRIILKDLKIGLRHEKLLSFLHPDAPEVYNNNPNLRELAEDDEIRNTKKRIFSSISLGKPFYPMLCKRQDLDPSSKTSQLFRDKTGLLQKFRVEDKLDGERVIAHKQGSNVLMFSRNCNSLIDYANVFQKEFNECILADDVILDGEMMAWDSDMGCFLPFGQNRTVVLEQQEMGHSAHKWMCYKVFDILWANNVKVETNDDQVPSGDMTGQPLEHRKQWLHRLIVDSPLKLERMEGNVVATEMQSEQEEAVVKYFEDSINRQAEGIVVKQCNSTYTPGDRKGSWVKVKPEYMEGAADTLDVVIVGGYYAEGARRSGISHFLVAVADPSGGFEADEDYEAPSSSATNPQDGRTQLPKRWRVLCKVGSGYNKEELLEIQERLRDFWKKVPKRENTMNRDIQMPEFLCGWAPRTAEEVPDVVIEPKNSIVLELVGAELVPSTDMNSGYYLRFPRVLRRRDDKLVSEADTVAELRKIWQQKGGKMSKTHEDSSYKLLKRRKDTGNAANKKQKSGQDVADRFMVPSGSGNVSLDILEGKAVYSIPLNTREMRSLPEEIRSQAKVDSLIEELGGKVRKTFSEADTQLVIAASEQNVALKNLLKFMEKSNIDLDVLSPQWLLDCRKAGRNVPVEKFHAIVPSKATKEAMKFVTDQYGDHFTREVGVEDVRKILDTVPKDIDVCVDSCEELIPLFEKEQFFRMRFAGICAYFAGMEWRSEDPGLNSLVMANLLFRLEGGPIAEQLHEGVTHVFVDENVTDLEEVSSWDLPEACIVLQSQWIHDSYYKGEFVESSPYRLL